MTAEDLVVASQPIHIHILLPTMHSTAVRLNQPVMLRQMQMSAALTLNEETNKYSFAFTFPIFLSLVDVAGQRGFGSPRVADSKGRKWWLDVYPDGAAEHLPHGCPAMWDAITMRVCRVR